MNPGQVDKKIRDNIEFTSVTHTAQVQARFGKENANMVSYTPSSDSLPLRIQSELS
jgi:hypothetical protein